MNAQLIIAISAFAVNQEVFKYNNSQSEYNITMNSR